MIKVLALALTVAVTVAQAQPQPPPGFTIPDTTLSPDKRLGVLVPDLDKLDAGAKNQLVEVNSGRVLGVIVGNPTPLHMNHVSLTPTRWSSDGSLLLWRAEGKWFPWTLVLIKLKGNAIEWQLDLLKAAQNEIIARCRKAAPKKYAAARKENAGSGTAFPEGFTVDVTTDGEDSPSVALPLKVHVTLTSDPKAISDYPKAAQLDASMEAEVGADGKFQVSKFQLK